MIAVPPATPVTIPLPEPILAIEPLLLLHAPPAVPSVSDSVEPIHKDPVLPVIAPGTAFIVITAATPQPVADNL